MKSVATLRVHIVGPNGTSYPNEAGVTRSDMFPTRLREPLDCTKFAMFTLPRISLPSFLKPVGNHPSVDLPSVEIHDIETSAEKRPRTLKHLLKANHANYSILYHDLRFHNHTPHVRHLSP